MIDRCPICGEWYESYSHGSGGCWFESDNQTGLAAQTIIDVWETVPAPTAPKLKPVAVSRKTVRY